MSAPEDCQFVALSYVWGDDYASAAESTSKPLHFPLTVEDSLLATLALGYQYLWVDRYVCYPKGSFAGLGNMRFGHPDAHTSSVSNKTMR
jgi:hypothetical protein